MALAASLYPAWYITSFAPALVVKGSFGGTRSGRRLRTLLLGVQFFISIGLIIATSFIRLQHDYMMHYDMGFDKENLLAVRLSERGAVSYDALRQKLLSDPQVKDVTGAGSFWCRSGVWAGAGSSRAVRSLSRVMSYNLISCA